MAHAGTKLSECRPKNLKNVKFCHVRISTFPANVDDSQQAKTKRPTKYSSDFWTMSPMGPHRPKNCQKWHFWAPICQTGSRNMVATRQIDFLTPVSMGLIKPCPFTIHTYIDSNIASRFYRATAMLSAVYAVVVCLCVCVCVSVTLRYSIKTAKRRIMRITLHDSPLTFWHQSSLQNLNGITPYWCDKCRWGGRKTRYNSKTVQDRHIVSIKSNRKTYVLYRMAMFPTNLGDP